MELRRGRAGIKKGRLGGHLVLARKVQVHQKDRGFRSKNVHSAQHKDGATVSTPQEGATVSTPQEGATAPTESQQVMLTEGVTTSSTPKSKKKAAFKKKLQLKRS